jgi:thiol:disulfide interchange protein DsbD
MNWLKTTAWVTGLVLAFLSVSSWALRSPAVGWHTYSEELILEAKKSDKPVIINFHAHWCLPCIKLDQKTFNHPGFIRAAKDFTLIQVDLTERGDPMHEALIGKYKISGVPTIIFLDKRGTERRDLRVEEYLNPQDFQSRMAKLIKVKTHQL